MYVSKPISSLQYYLVRKSHRNELFYDLFLIRQLGKLFFTQTSYKEDFGETVIRTRGWFDPTLPFQGSTIDHSDTSPKTKSFYHTVIHFFSVFAESV